MLPLAVLLLLPSFMLFSALLPLSFFFAVLFVAVAAVFAFFFDFSQTQWHISIDVVLFASSFSFSFGSSFFHVLSLHVGKSPSTFLSLSLPLLVPLSHL